MRVVATPTITIIAVEGDNPSGDKNTSDTTTVMTTEGGK